MSRDGRGNPGRYVPKNVPRLKLADLLRRRKMSLKQMLAEHGITTYETLVERCERMGVTPPERSEFAATNPPVVNSPAEGVVVIDAKPELEAPDLSLLALPETSEEPTEPSQKKPRKKREVQHNEESN